MATTRMSALERLEALRQLMADRQIDAYIVPTADSHNSEYPCGHDRRRAYISGFTGSAGTALITKTKALLWTDGRYFVQAEEELDSRYWTLMKEGTAQSISMPNWIRQNCSEVREVSADCFSLSVSLWRDITSPKLKASPQFIRTSGNLVDAVWAKEQDPAAVQPSLPEQPIVVHPMSLAGKSVADKLKELREKLAGNHGCDCVDCILLSETPDSAWLFNLRGNDFDFNPMFFSFALITQTAAQLFCHDKKLTSEARKHLELNSVVVRHYDDIATAIEEVEKSVSAEAARSAQFLMDPSVCFALYDVVDDPSTNVNLKTNPVQVAKSKKNAVELDCAKEAHLEDAIALCTYIAWLESAAIDGSILSEDEASCAKKLDDLRRKQPNNVGLSFPTISSMDSNGAIIHYSPPSVGSKKMTHGVYLVDSGGQYRGGTTDVTRTVHLGTPTDFQRECWTRVLKGHIALDSAIFPESTKGPQLDVLARMFLWKVGLNYRHGTGHGVGSQLSVHEGPCGISPQLRGSAAETPLEEGMILSNEPGFYLDGHFGFRLENLLHVVRVNPQPTYPVPTDTSESKREQTGSTNPPSSQRATDSQPSEASTPSEKYYGFECLTLIPYQTKMISKDLITSEEIEWLNSYHGRVWKYLSPRLDKKEDAHVLQWLKLATATVSV